MLNINVEIGKKGWLGDILVALSISNFALIPVFNPLFYSPESEQFFLPVHTWHHYLSSLILLVSLAAVFLPIIRLMRGRLPLALQLILLIPIGVYFVIIARGFFKVLDVPWGLIIDFIANMATVGIVSVVGIANIVIVGIVSVVGLGLIWAWRKQIVSIIYIVFLIFFPFALLNTVYASVDLAKTVVNPPPTYQKPLSENKAVPKPKVIYLLFDEFDYRFFFKEKIDRVAGVTLENLEYLKEATLFFTDVRSKVMFTLYSIPLITVGSDFSLGDVRTSKSEFYTKSMPWSESNHIFKMFKDAGYRISIIGFYQPLCRIFNKFTDHCGVFPGRMNPTLKEVVRGQFLSILPRLYLLKYVTEYLESEKEILAVLRSSSMDFMFFQVRVPHSPTIYDAKSKRLILPPMIENVRMYDKRITPSLYDNVQLVDVLLGKIIRLLKEEGVWDDSTVIIGTDHIWKKPHDGKFSKNVPLLIKLPMQKEGSQYHRTVDTKYIKPIIEQIALKGNNTIEGLTTWMDANVGE